MSFMTPRLKMAAQTEVTHPTHTSATRPAIGSVAARALLSALRPKQWSKNLIVFVGAAFALKLTDPEVWLPALGAFVAFCLLSSAGYLLNDVLDVEADRQHPLKRSRPLACGAISCRQAVGLAIFLALAALLLGLWVRPAFALVGVGYLILTLVYSAVLKHLVLVDLFAIAGGFVLRVVGGSVAVGVGVSPWLYVCTILAALFLGLAKRRQEIGVLEAAPERHRRNLSEYTTELVDQLMIVVTSATIMAYSLYTFSAPNLPDNNAMMATIPLVLYGLFRYLYLVRVKGLGGSPEDLLLSDRPLLAAALAWALLSAGILYLLR
jgi:4-hydroxybenzoate polyprenyltransferase